MSPLISHLIFFLAFIFTFNGKAHAWGKRGHVIVCETAAYLTSNEPHGKFLKSHSFDLGYYCNVPDFIWKRPASYKKEFFNHFMDLEIFDRELKDSKLPDPFELTREKFNSTFPKIDNKAGRSWWRIRELDQQVAQKTKKLEKSKLKKEERHQLQAEWLSLMGAIGHYVGDLAQPLHVTENYDGQMTKQKGIHHYFEETLVDELYAQGLQKEVMEMAQKKWNDFKKQNQKTSTLELLKKLSRSSSNELKPLLAIDKKVGRKNDKKSAQAFRQMIVERLSEGALYQAELLKRRLGWKYNGDKFFLFLEAPNFVEL